VGAASARELIIEMDMTFEKRVRVVVLSPFGLLGMAMAGAALVGLLIQRAIS
jgi:hypothetical protein